MAAEYSTRHAHNFVDITGRSFGRLIVLGYSHTKSKFAHWHCLCSCGNTKTISGQSLKRGLTKSCGCLNKECIVERQTKYDWNKIHRSTYACWNKIKNRCYNTADKGYKHWGGRGITVCEAWKHSFAAFHADMGNKPSSQHSIDRIDNSKGYSPDNCRWATASEQSRNTRRNRFLTFNGETMCVAEWAAKLKVPSRLLNIRLSRGWSTERAFTTPLIKRRA